MVSADAHSTTADKARPDAALVHRMGILERERENGRRGLARQHTGAKRGTSSPSTSTNWKNTSLGRVQIEPSAARYTTISDRSDSSVAKHTSSYRPPL